MLHGIGFFISSLRDDDLPAPQELIGPDPRLITVAAYLDHGITHESYRGLSWCRFGCGEVQMGSRDLTDGVWLWPEGLSHYLRIHSVRLPEAFITHALAAQPPLPAQDGAVADLQLWIEWSRPFRSATLRTAIKTAQDEDDKLATAARQARVDANTAKYGESNSICIQARCGKRALSGIAFCAYHLPEMVCENSFRFHSHRLLSDTLRHAP